MLRILNIYSKLMLRSGIILLYIRLSLKENHYIIIVLYHYTQFKNVVFRRGVVYCLEDDLVKYRSEFRIEIHIVLTNERDILHVISSQLLS